MYTKKTVRTTTLLLCLLIPTVSLMLTVNSQAVGIEWDLYYKITDERTYNKDFSYGSNIEIRSGGSLTLENLIFTIYSKVRIDVYSGGTLVINNVTFARDTYNNETEFWNMRIYDGAIVNITNSMLSFIGATGENTYYNDANSIWVNSSTVHIQNNTFKNFEFGQIVITGSKNSTLNISNNLFESSNYGSPYAIFFHETQGIINQGGLIIQNNTFIENRGFSGYKAQYINLLNNKFSQIGSYNEWAEDACINFDNCSYLNIRNNLFQESNYGIIVSNIYNLTIQNNTFIDNKYNLHIYSTNQLGLSENQFIRNNRNFISYSDSDVYLDVNNSIITGNNWVYKSKLEIPIQPLSFNLFTELSYQNTIDTTNKINDHPLRIYKNQNNQIIDLTGLDTGHVMVINCQNVSFQNVIIKNAGGFLISFQSSNITLANLSIIDPFTLGIKIGNYYYQSNDIIINNCTITGAKSTGLVILYVNYFLLSNSIFNNNRIGVFIESSNYGIIESNTIQQNGNPINTPIISYQNYPYYGGIFMKYGSYNLINNNLFKSNWYWALSFGASNANTSASNHNTITNNQFIQFISPKALKYSVCVYDYSDNNTYANNIYSDHFSSYAYYINGTGNRVEGTNIGLYLDDDNDGVHNFAEIAWGSNYINSNDTDGDMVSDSDEIKIYLSNPNDTDTDGDDLSDFDENIWGSNLLKVDTDGDGFSDGIEVAYLASPTNSTSFPGSSLEPEDYQGVAEDEPEQIINAINGFPISIFLASSMGMGLILYKKSKKSRSEGIIR